MDKMYKVELLLTLVESIDGVIVNRGEDDQGTPWSCIRIPQCDGYKDIVFYDDDFIDIITN